MPPIYLDHNATTPLAQAARDILVQRTDGAFGNPNAPYAAGRRAYSALNQAREMIAAHFQCRPSEWILTSGATESNVTVLHHHILTRERPIILVGAAEHPSVIKAAEQYAAHGRCSVKMIPVDGNGVVDLEWLSEHVTDAHALFLMSVNNETGTKLDMEAVGTIVREHGIWWHCDLVAEAGKARIAMRHNGYDAITSASVSAHKCNGPLGLGLLYLKQGRELVPIMPALSQEGGYRAGTPDAVKAMALAAALQTLPGPDPRPLQDLLWTGIEQRFPGSIRNGHPTRNDGHTLNVSICGREKWVDAEALVIDLALEDIAVATGAACATGSGDPSHVLLAMGRTPEQAQAAIRFSFGLGNREQEIPCVLDALSRLLS